MHNPSDAIDAQARFDAALAGQVKTAQAAGQIHSSASVTEMALGAYNAGFGAVLASGGIPQNSQTMAYVPRIMTLARTTFSDAGTITAPAPDAGVQHARDAYDAAKAGGWTAAELNKAGLRAPAATRTRTTKTTTPPHNTRSAAAAGGNDTAVTGAA